MTNSIDTFLFDLDGTLLDTHVDMANALNVLLSNHNKPTLPIEKIRPLVSKGAIAMVCMAFNCEPGSDRATKYWREFLDAYAQNICEHTQFFEGMDTVIDAIENSGRQWGIVTNKPEFLTEPLLQNLGLDHRPGCVVSGDTLAHKKPHPAPLLLACEQMNSSPDRSIYIGDDERDIEAGRRAGMATIAAAYGFIIEGDNPENWNADAVIQDPIEILNWLN